MNKPKGTPPGRWRREKYLVPGPAKSNYPDAYTSYLVWEGPEETEPTDSDAEQTDDGLDREWIEADLDGDIDDEGDGSDGRKE